MAHDNQRNFCLSVRKSHPCFFNKKLVLDIGSLDINGNNKFLFSSCQYIGVDVSQGANVDIVTPGHLLELPDSTFDTIISTECFEHDRYYSETLNNIIRLLKPGGMFLFTCATTGRPEHGTARTTPGDAPLIQEMEDWRDYYKNLTENDIRAVLDVESIFSEFEFSVNNETFDLYFFGVKNGELLERDNYSFLLDTRSGQLGLEYPGTHHADVNSCITSDQERGGNKYFVVTSPNQSGGVHLVCQTEYVKVSDIPCAGVASGLGSFYFGIQPDKLLAIGVKKFSFSTPELDDIHDILVHDDGLYIVGTNKNIIVKYDLNGVELQRWVFPGEPDSRHINCLGVWGGRVIFSAFGEFQYTREYKGVTLGNGYIQELESGKRLISGLNQPHSLVEVAGNIVFANSGSYEIAEYDNRGRFVRKKTFDSYVRGVAINKNHLAVGLSKSRDSDSQSISSARLVVLDANTWEYIYSVGIESDEIYTVASMLDVGEARYLSDQLMTYSLNLIKNKNAELLISLAERDRHVSLMMKALRDENEELLRGLISQDWYKAQYGHLIPKGANPNDHFFELGGIDEGCMPSDNPGLVVGRYISSLQEHFADQVIVTEKNCQSKINALNEKLSCVAFEFSATLESYRSATEREKERLKDEIYSDWSVRENQYGADIKGLEAENRRLIGEVGRLSEFVCDLTELREKERIELQRMYAEKIVRLEGILDSRLSGLSDSFKMHADHSRSQLEDVSIAQQQLIARGGQIERAISDFDINLKLSIADTARDIESNISDLVSAHADQSRGLLESISIEQQQLIVHGGAIEKVILDLDRDLKVRIDDSVRNIESSIDAKSNKISSEVGLLMALVESIRQEILSIYSSKAWRWMAILKNALNSRQDSSTAELLQEDSLFSSSIDRNLSFKRNISENYQMNNNIGDLMSLYSESFVVAAYQHILGRDPDPDGLSYYTACLRSGKDRVDVLGQIYNSEEARGRGFRDNGIEDLMQKYRKSKGIGGFWRRLTGEDIRSRLSQIEGHVGRIESLLTRIPHGRLEGIAVEEKRVMSPQSNAPFFNLRLADGKNVIILTTPHCSYVADLMVRALEKIAISARVIFEMPHHGYDDVPHIVICPQMFPVLPGFYVAYQMEQSVSSRWFTGDYFKRLENSFAIFDYSLTNIAHLQSEGLSMKQINYLPIGYIPAYKRRVSALEEYDVLFYGDINNDRRRLYISEISKRYKVKVINDCFGHELYSEMAKAKVVINVHYYEGALLETTRIFECLSNHKLIVSERSSDMDQHAGLEDVIDFVAVGNVQEMLVRLDYWLSDDARRLAKVKQNTVLLDKGFNEFEFYFYRFLLATDNIKYGQFWSIIGKYKPLNGSRLCLNLPEAVARGNGFRIDNFYGFEVFPGLKHSLGWVGCALSYKYMIMLAREHGLSRVSICEDDVEFPDGFSEKIGAVERYLDSVGCDWDIFSGLLANLNEGANVLGVEDVGDLRFVTVDRLISTVFNIYDSRVYNVISNWDPDNRDVESNTIDRYLESNSKLKVVTTSPFLVGHKEEEYSTLWGFKNTQYRDLINASSILLKNKINEYGQGALV